MTKKSWDLGGNRNRLYGRRWRNARGLYLASNPLCVMCKLEDKTRAATVVDHVVPHRGNEELFWDKGNWQPLCSHHHNSHKAREEIRGFSDVLGKDGWPVDPEHPANSGKVEVSARAKPDDLRRIAVPVLMVCGPPGAGKTTWCKEVMGANDLLVDFDEIDARLNGTARRKNKLLAPILRERNQLLLDAVNMSSGRVFFPTTISTENGIAWWKHKLGNVVVITVPTPAKLCIERIESDSARDAECDQLIERTHRWWQSCDLAPDAILVASGGTFDLQNPPDWTPAPKVNVDLLLDLRNQKEQEIRTEEFTI